jgi:hypothetical protein
MVIEEEGYGQERKEPNDDVGRIVLSVEGPKPYREHGDKGEYRIGPPGCEVLPRAARSVLDESNDHLVGIDG